MWSAQIFVPYVVNICTVFPVLNCLEARADDLIGK